MLIKKRSTLLPINCYYGISVLAKNEAVLISIPWYTVFTGAPVKPLDLSLLLDR